jgi:hypothetical protein
MQDLFGGSNSSGGSQSTSSGFSGLPPEIQQAFTGLATGATNTINPGGTPNSSLFTPPALPQASQDALGQIQNQNFAITPQSIQSNINEQMNPYNSSVINQIENAQNGSLSQLNSYLSNSGTFGSNRGMVGASDISNVAADQIGSFLNGQYNTSLNNALTTIPQNNAQSAAGSVQAGQTQQQQQMAAQQAPVTALGSLAQIMGVLPSNSNQSQSSSISQSTSNNGIFKSIGI